MPTFQQLVRKIQRPLRKYKTRVKDLKRCPQKRGICFKLFIMTPKKPNSAKRKVAKIKLSTKKFVFGYIPGEGNNLQRFSQVLIRGGLIRDLPGVHYTIIRGKLDLHSVYYRRQGRSKYGTKIWWKPKKKDRSGAKLTLKKQNMDFIKKKIAQRKARIYKKHLLNWLVYNLYVAKNKKTKKVLFLPKSLFTKPSFAHVENKKMRNELKKKLKQKQQKSIYKFLVKKRQQLLGTDYLVNLRLGKASIIQPRPIQTDSVNVMEPPKIHLPIFHSHKRFYTNTSLRNIVKKIHLQKFKKIKSRVILKKRKVKTLVRYKQFSFKVKTKKQIKKPLLKPYAIFFKQKQYFFNIILNILMKSQNRILWQFFFRKTLTFQHKIFYNRILFLNTTSFDLLSKVSFFSSIGLKQKFLKFRKVIKFQFLPINVFSFANCSYPNSHIYLIFMLKLKELKQKLSLKKKFGIKKNIHFKNSNAIFFFNLNNYKKKYKTESTSNLFFLDKFMRTLIKNGKKTQVDKLFTQLTLFSNKQFNISALILIILMLQHITMAIELIPMKQAGRILFIPVLLPLLRQITFGLKLFKKNSNSRVEQTYFLRILNELLDIVLYQKGLTMQKLSKINELAFNSQPNIHYRWKKLIP